SAPTPPRPGRWASVRRPPPSRGSPPSACSATISSCTPAYWPANRGTMSQNGMCGIVGLYNFGGSTEASARDRDRGLVLDMNDAIQHRGPDDFGLWQSDDGRVVLGHRRLAIVDLSPAGHQPMSNEDGTVWITFNGEIYNHAELRQSRRLDDRHKFRSRADTEVIIHPYR